MPFCGIPTLKINCAVCGVETMVVHSLQTRCDPCQKIHRRDKNKNKTKNCGKCGAEFKSNSNRTVLCPECREWFDCGACGAKTRRNGSWQLYCSTRCRNRAKTEELYNWNYGKVLERDGNKCRRCGSGDELHLHHIDYSGFEKTDGKANNDMGNLITLCESCHQSLHSLTNRTLVKRYEADVKAILEKYIGGA